MVLDHSLARDAQPSESEVKWSEVAQSCPTLCDAMDCSLLCSSVPGIFQARVLEWVAIGLYVLSVVFGEGNGNLLQYSCLENPMDRGASWATVPGVTKSRIWLKWLSTWVVVIFLYFYHLTLLLIKPFILKGIIQKALGELDSLAGRDLEDSLGHWVAFFSKLSNWATREAPDYHSRKYILHHYPIYTCCATHTCMYNRNRNFIKWFLSYMWALCIRASFSVSYLSSSFFILFSGPLFVYSFHPVFYSFKFSLVFSIFFLIIFSLLSLFIPYSILFYKC